MGFKSKFPPVLLAALFCLITQVRAQEPSICWGSPQAGRIENAWPLPTEGKNFELYSRVGSIFGRNYVHSQVYQVIVQSFQALSVSDPALRFVIGETGLQYGGQFRPHKTHQNGLSVDFFVPVLDRQSRPSSLPRHLFNRFGYGIEFDKRAHFGEYHIDFEAIAKHLIALKIAADQAGLGIRVVIFDNDFQTMLRATEAGKKLPTTLKFSTKKPWIRHDEHYHIDFELACLPMPQPILSR